MAKIQREDVERRRPLLAEPKKRLMLTALIRREDLFLRAQIKLTPDCFTDQDLWMATIWSICSDYFEEYSELPTKEILCAELGARLDEDPESFDDDDIEDADVFITAAFDVDPTVFRADQTLKYLQQFLEDNLFHMARERLAVPQLPEDVAEHFADLSKQAGSIRTVSSAKLDEPFFDGWDQEDAAIETRSTGVPFLDNFMDGGESVCESYGIVGPYGGGKTLLGVQLAVAGAAACHEEWCRNGRQGPLGVAYLVHYEELAKSLRIRALSCLAEIPKDTINDALTAKSYCEFSRSDGLKPYEQHKYADAIRRGEKVHGEYERLRHAQLILNTCFRLVDMTGHNSKRTSSGDGLIPEIAADISADMEARKLEGNEVFCRTVVVDFVLDAIEKHLENEGKDSRELRHLINRWPSQMKKRVGIPFNCPTWSLHQLNSESNKFSPGRVPSLIDSAEGRGFAKNLDFGFALGVKTADGHAILNCDKHRRDEQKQPMIVQMDAQYARFLDTNGTWVLDTNSSEIVRADELMAVDGGMDAEEEEAASSTPRRRRRRRRTSAAAQNADVQEDTTG